MRLMDEARQASIKVAVCSAATKSSVIHVVKSLLGEERFEVICLRSWPLADLAAFQRQKCAAAFADVQIHL